MAEYRRSCDCRFGQSYPSIPEGRVIIGCTEDNIWCTDCIAQQCEMFEYKEDAHDDRNLQES